MVGLGRRSLQWHTPSMVDIPKFVCFSCKVITSKSESILLTIPVALPNFKVKYFSTLNYGLEVLASIYRGTKISHQ